MSTVAINTKKFEVISIAFKEADDKSLKFSMVTKRLYNKTIEKKDIDNCAGLFGNEKVK